jgi:hypothetical protein
MPIKLTEEQKAESRLKRKEYLKNYMRLFMKQTYGDDKREYNRLAAQKRRTKIKNDIDTNPT